MIFLECIQWLKWNCTIFTQFFTNSVVHCKYLIIIFNQRYNIHDCTGAPALTDSTMWHIACNSAIRTCLHTVTRFTKNVNEIPIGRRLNEIHIAATTTVWRSKEGKPPTFQVLYTYTCISTSIIAKFDEDKSLIFCIESIKDLYCYYYIINGTRKIYSV